MNRDAKIFNKALANKASQCLKLVRSTPQQPAEIYLRHAKSIWGYVNMPKTSDEREKKYDHINLWKGIGKYNIHSHLKK